MFMMYYNILIIKYLYIEYKSSQAEGHEFEPRLPLLLKIKQLQVIVAAFLCYGGDSGFSFIFFITFVRQNNPFY